MEGAKGQGPKGVSPPADYSLVEAKTAAGQNSSESELQIGVQKLKEEIERLRLTPPYKSLSTQISQDDEQDSRSFYGIFMITLY